MARKPKQVKAHLKIHLLQGKSITQLQAFQMWRTTRLAVFINRLRKEGLKIQTIMVKAGTDACYAKYRHVY